MSEEFNLSEKGERFYKPTGDNLYFNIKDVKEFIFLLKERLLSAIDMPINTKEQVNTLNWITEKIDKLAGDKLTGQKEK